MTPIKFPQVNVTFAKNQPEYLPLPAYRRVCGEVTTCWKLSWREAFRLLFTRRLWLQQLTFNKPLQPQLPRAECPFKTEPPDRFGWDEYSKGEKLRIIGAASKKIMDHIERKL